MKLEIGNQQRKSTKPKPDDSVNIPLATLTVNEYHKNISRKYRINLHGFGLDKCLLGMTSKAQSYNRKKQVNFTFQIKKIVLRDIIKRVKGNPKNRRKYL